MKKITIILGVVVIGATLWFLRSTGNEYSEKKVQKAEHNAKNKPIQSSKERFAERRRKQIEQREEVKKGIQEANVPISFWGRVLDQDGKPLEGVSILYRVGKPRIMWDTNTVVRNTATDVNGAFSIKDKGDGFSFEEFKKEGYRKTKGQNFSFTYASNSERYVPEKAKPEVYMMVKEGELPSLIHKMRGMRLAWDGTPVYYDFKTGTLGQTGGVKITALRGEVKGVGSKARYDWSFRIEALEGGVLKTKPGDDTVAPEEGFMPFWECGYVSSDPEWRMSKRSTHFVFRFPDGNYGRLNTSISSDPRRNMHGLIYSYLNSSGGRILEYEATRKSTQ